MRKIGRGVWRLRAERWATKIGLVLALAGNAIGLGNFLRFRARPR
jgi:SNF family Na+-dependent transporter